MLVSWALTFRIAVGAHVIAVGILLLTVCVRRCAFVAMLSRTLPHEVVLVCSRAHQCGLMGSVLNLPSRCMFVNCLGICCHYACCGSQRCWARIALLLEQLALRNIVTMVDAVYISPVGVTTLKKKILPLMGIATKSTFLCM